MTTGDKHHKQHVIVWLALVFITLVAVNAVLFSIIFKPADNPQSDDTSVCGDGICTATEQACVPTFCIETETCRQCTKHYCPSDCTYAGDNDNTESEQRVSTPTQMGNVSINCAAAEDCTLIDSTYDASVCCQGTRCTDYASDDYVAVNTMAYQALIDTAAAGCAATQCPQLVAPDCHTVTTNDAYTVACVNSICQKNYIGNEQLPLTNEENL